METFIGVLIVAAALAIGALIYFMNCDALVWALYALFFVLLTWQPRRTKAKDER